MRVMSLDCEYNQPSGKTIEIGAAVFNPITGELLDQFHSYVNPCEPINPEITQLTTITDDMVKDAPTIIKAFEALEWLHAKHQCFINPIVWGSGVRNDSHHIWQESGVDRPNFMGYRVFDAKTLYQSRQIMRNERVRSGLANSMKTLGLKFEGRAHTAFADAVNTFTIWHCLSKEFTCSRK